MLDLNGRDDAKKLWTNVILAYVSSNNSLKCDYGIIWADKITEAYIERTLHV